MGHDVHFLSRLERVALPHAELALSLYRDPELVRAILAFGGIPEGAERVAMALTAAGGPYVVVTREGHFVTCLAEDMAPHDVTIIARGQLDAVAAKLPELRKRMAQAVELVGSQSEVGKLMGRLFEAGHALSREEMYGVSVFTPVLGVELHLMLVDIEQGLKVLEPHLARITRPRKQDHELLHTYWCGVWASAHLVVLAAMDAGREVVSQIAEHLRDERFSLSWPTSIYGSTCLALRGAWAVGKVGKPLLPAYKRLLAAATNPASIVDAAAGLAAIGLRHSGLRSEVRKVLQGTPGGVVPDYGIAVRDTLLVAFDRSDDARSAVRDAVVRTSVARGIGLPRGHGYRFEHAADVPDDLVVPCAANYAGDFLNLEDDLSFMLMSLAWIARARPEELYFPRAYLDVFDSPWTPEDTLSLVAPARRHYGKPAPARVASTPGRNEPCPCGSGKKYKHCHGA